MPTYEFRCPRCEQTAELNARISMAEKIAVTCGCGIQMRRTFSAPGLVFKGDGWAGKKPRKREDDGKAKPEPKPESKAG